MRLQIFLKTVGGMLVTIATASIAAFLMLSAVVPSAVGAGSITEALWATAVTLVYGLDPASDILYIPLLAWGIGSLLGGLVTGWWGRGAIAGFVAAFIAVISVAVLQEHVAGAAAMTAASLPYASLSAMLATIVGTLGGLTAQRVERPKPAPAPPAEAASVTPEPEELLKEALERFPPPPTSVVESTEDVEETPEEIFALTPSEGADVSSPESEGEVKVEAAAPPSPPEPSEDLEWLMAKRKQIGVLLSELTRSYEMGLVRDELYASLKEDSAKELEAIDGWIQDRMEELAREVKELKEEISKRKSEYEQLSQLVSKRETPG